jgi:DNA-binding XRE family transcriptional regulator
MANDYPMIKFTVEGKPGSKGERIMRLRQDHLAELLQDEAFREAYENLEPEFEIAEMLLEYRAAEGITQEELAKRIKINRSDLSKLESGSANPTLKTLKKIASVLRVKLKFVDDIPF